MGGGEAGGDACRAGMCFSGVDSGLLKEASSILTEGELGVLKLPTPVTEESFDGEAPKTERTKQAR